jgi:hypothetical protein
MRIIGNIEHPSLKISVFKNEGRTSVKFETSLYEQTYKLGDDERFATLEGIQKLVDNQLLDQVQQGFRLMHSARLESMSRSFPVQTEGLFEEII